MGIKHADTKSYGEKGYASEWNKDHVIDGNVDFDSHKGINVTDPTSNQDTATKKYVDDKITAITPATSQVSATAEDDHTLPLATFTLMNSMSVSHTSNTGKVLVMFSADIWPGFNNLSEVKLQKDGVDVSGAKRELYFNGNAESGGGVCTIHILDTNATTNTWRIMWRVAVGTDDLIAFDRVLTIIDI